MPRLRTATGLSLLGLLTGSAVEGTVARRREGDVGPGARLLVPGIEAEFRRIDIGVVQKVAVVVHDLQGFTALDADFGGMELPSFFAKSRMAAMPARQAFRPRSRGLRPPVRRRGDEYAASRR